MTNADVIISRWGLMIRCCYVWMKCLEFAQLGNPVVAGLRFKYKIIYIYEVQNGCGRAQR